MGSDEGLSRRDLLRKAGLGGAALLGGSLLGASVGDDAQASTEADVYAGGHGGQM
ncbi:MAG: twin-arginine translocation signal domain-containing protein, partial [Actinomycetota bacterium]